MKKFLCVLLLLPLVLFAASCGGDSDDSASGGETEAASTTSGGSGDFVNNSGSDEETTQRAIDAATALAEELGKHELPKDITIGHLNLADALEISRRTEVETQAAVDYLGWDMISCDGGADPAKFATCMDSLLDQGVDAIIIAAIESAPIRPQLEKAKRNNVPVINTIGIIEDDPELLAAQLAPPERESELTAALDEWVFEQIDEAGIENPKMSYTWFPIAAGELRREQLLKDLKQRPDIEVVSTHSTDLTDAIQDSRNYTEATIQANPDINVFWEAAAPNLPAVADVIEQRSPDTQFPDRPLIVGHLDDTLNLEKIRAGTADAVGTVPVMIDSWVAIDQLAQYFARDAEIERNATFESEDIYGLKFENYHVVTQDNVPPEGETVPWGEDIPTFFTTLWSEEFGIGG